ncbi:hypothetical protein PPROV_000814400 [Pycnococcus provasolii]|uniref:F-box domain-containing protein n=2 Tax=Pycnococcus provasolii TaxID=41880 RepID=A0A830HX00_9CHLO|nr:hypothetical protein PPROV_000814400 [Pycnococcus provasolii]
MAQQDSNMDVEPPRHHPGTAFVSTAFGSQYQNEHTGGFEYQQSQYNNPDEVAHMHGANDDVEGGGAHANNDNDNDNDEANGGGLVRRRVSRASILEDAATPTRQAARTHEHNSRLDGDHDDHDDDQDNDNYNAAAPAPSDPRVARNQHHDEDDDNAAAASAGAPAPKRQRMLATTRAESAVAVAADDNADADVEQQTAATAAPEAAVAPAASELHVLEVSGNSVQAALDTQATTNANVNHHAEPSVRQPPDAPENNADANGDGNGNNNDDDDADNQPMCWQSMPETLLIKVFHQLRRIDGTGEWLASAGRVCRLWRRLANEVVLQDDAQSRPAFRHQVLIQQANTELTLASVPALVGEGGGVMADGEGGHPASAAGDAPQAHQDEDDGAYDSRFDRVEGAATAEVAGIAPTPTDVVTIPGALALDTMTTQAELVHEPETEADVVTDAGVVPRPTASADASFGIADQLGETVSWARQNLSAAHS